MKAALSLEAIGLDTIQIMRFWRDFLNEGEAGLGDNFVGRWPARWWVAEITGLHPRYKFDRQFLRGKYDYAEANSKGSRGVKVWYVLESGHYYEICSPISWARNHRYFAKVTLDGEIIEVPEDEVRKWASDDISA